MMMMMTAGEEGEAEGDDQCAIYVWMGWKGMGLPVCRSNYMYRIPVSTNSMKGVWDWLSGGKSSCSRRPGRKGGL